MSSVMAGTREERMAALMERLGSRKPGEEYSIALGIIEFWARDAEDSPCVARERIVEVFDALTEYYRAVMAR